MTVAGPSLGSQWSLALYKVLDSPLLSRTYCQFTKCDTCTFQSCISLSWSHLLGHFYFFAGKLHDRGQDNERQKRTVCLRTSQCGTYPLKSWQVNLRKRKIIYFLLFIPFCKWFSSQIFFQIFFTSTIYFVKWALDPKNS